MTVERPACPTGGSHPERHGPGAVCRGGEGEPRHPQTFTGAEQHGYGLSVGWLYF